MSLRGALSLTLLLIAAPLASDARAGEGARPAPLAPRTEARAPGIVALRAGGSDRVLIAGGTFSMGSREEEVEVAVALCKRETDVQEFCEKSFARELEAHDVTLSPFFIDRTEVTVASYRRCVHAGRCTAPPYAAGGQRFDRPDYPVTLVSWSDADDYCRYVGGRLPTEAEWERAARGVERRQFPWGNLYNKHLSNHGVHGIENSDDSDGFAELAPVGSFSDGRTPDGIDDLAGNAEEWVFDAIDDIFSAHYAPHAEVNPKGAAAGVFHAVRGGSYQSGAAWVRGATRSFRPTSERQPFRGFRCVHPATGEL